MMHIGWSSEEKRYVATDSRYDRLQAFGETADEAVAEVEAAMKLFDADEEEEK